MSLLGWTKADFEGAGIGINETLPLFHKMVREGDNLVALLSTRGANSV